MKGCPRSFSVPKKCLGTEKEQKRGQTTTCKIKCDRHNKILLKNQ